MRRAEIPYRVLQLHLQEIGKIIAESGTTIALFRGESMATYTGHITESGEFGIVMKDSRIMNPADSLKVENHSPDGFSWGYHGSGPTQLALAILLEEWGNWQSFPPRSMVHGHHIQFRDNVIAKMPRDEGWQLTSKEIEDWYVTGVWTQRGVVTRTLADKLYEAEPEVFEALKMTAFDPASDKMLEAALLWAYNQGVTDERAY